MRSRRGATYRGAMARTPSDQTFHAAFGDLPRVLPVELDGAILWGCSMKGWNCCVDKGIPVRPYDMIRLRHALARPAHEITDEELVTFAWNPTTGTMIGSLAHQPYGRDQVACVFLDEVTNLDARRLRETAPERFRSLPDRVQRAAGSKAKGEWRVAGLCRVHSGRPEACRAFPFQRAVEFAEDGTAGAVSVLRVNDCGTCALASPTTPRQVIEAEAVDDYWRARGAFWLVERYLRGIGLANIEHPQYRAFPLQDVAQLWLGMYLPDADEAVLATFPEQWRAPSDLAGDWEIHRMLLERALERGDALVADSGRPPSGWGFEGEAAERPDLDEALNLDTPMLPPPPALSETA